MSGRPGISWVPRTRLSIPGVAEGAAPDAAVAVATVAGPAGGATSRALAPWHPDAASTTKATTLDAEAIAKTVERTRARDRGTGVEAGIRTPFG